MIDNAQQLIDKFMAGKTTHEEDKLLATMLRSREQTEEMKILLAMLEMPKWESSDEIVLGADNEKEYDHIVKCRKRRKVLTAFAVAASIVGIVFILGLWLRNSTTDIVVQDNTLVAQSKDKEATRNEANPNKNTIAEIERQAVPSKASPTKVVKQPKQDTFENQETDNSSLMPMTKALLREQLITEQDISYADSVAYMMAYMEREMEYANANAYIAHVYEIIDTDETLQKEINRIIHESLTNEELSKEAINTF